MYNLYVYIFVVTWLSEKNSADTNRFRPDGFINNRFAPQGKA